MELTDFDINYAPLSFIFNEPTSFLQHDYITPSIFYVKDKNMFLVNYQFSFATADMVGVNDYTYDKENEIKGQNNRYIKEFFWGLLQ